MLESPPHRDEEFAKSHLEFWGLSVVTQLLQNTSNEYCLVLQRSVVGPASALALTMRPLGGWSSGVRGDF
jgi:hypothetical protein